MRERALAGSARRVRKIFGSDVVKLREEFKKRAHRFVETHRSTEHNLLKRGRSFSPQRLIRCEKKWRDEGRYYAQFN